MNIAFISYEFPPDTADGGIATYVYQASSMLHSRGHHVEVFAGSRTRTGSTTENGVMVHRIRAKDNDMFAHDAGAAFVQRHHTVHFDVLEGPDYSADAREAVRLAPDIPLVVRLHTPSILLLRLNYYESSLRGKLRFAVSALRKGRASTWGYGRALAVYRELRRQIRIGRHMRHADRRERAHAALADELCSPSLSLRELIAQLWGVEAGRISHVPYAFTPSTSLLSIAADSMTNVVTFLGRLEVRKGVLDLAQAIPLVIRRHPAVRFQFVGPSEDSPKRGMAMKDYLHHELRAHHAAVEFPGPVPPDQVPGVLAGTDICVFPSLWENFPCVCLEAMAAARGIVGSAAGGMSEMLEEGVAGMLVRPRSPKAIAAAINDLLDDPARRVALGTIARRRLLTEYNIERIGSLHEASYSRAISRRQARGRRPSTDN
jgi:glycogen(starch) synthase